MGKCRSKVKEPCSSSIASANTMPTTVRNSRVVLIVRLICHDEKSTKKSHFAKQVSIKVDYIFLHIITGLAPGLPMSNNQIFCKDEIKSM